jgi:hypothetical protein
MFLPNDSGTVSFFKRQDTPKQDFGFPTRGIKRIRTSHMLRGIGRKLFRIDMISLHIGNQLRRPVPTTTLRRATGPWLQR